MGTGDIPDRDGRAAQALWVFDATSWGPRPVTREEYVAWPPPGFVPYQVVYPRWSFSYPRADFASATVIMTQGDAGVPLILEPVQDGPGDNTLAWIPSGMQNADPWPKPSSDTTYTVTISDVIISGIPRSFIYDVTVFDPATIPPNPDPALELNLNQFSFHRSQQLTLSATVTPGSSPNTADIYMALQLPDGSLLFFLAGGSFTTAPQPIVSNWAISAFSGQIFSYTFGEGELVGNYSWFAAFTQPDTLNLIGPIVSAPFSVSP